MVGVDHRGPPLDGDAVVGDDGPAHADGDLPLRAGAALPVLADGVAAEVGRAEDAGPVGGVGCEQVDDLVGVGGFPGPPVALGPLAGSHGHHLQDAVVAGVLVAPRQRFLRFHVALSALLTVPFLPSLPLSPIFLLLILPSVSCILILLCSPSHQCTSERARSVKIIWR
jgi:hypothetical protein